MSVNPQENQAAEAPKLSDKELNFRKQEEMYNRKLEQERQARAEVEQRLAQLTQQVASRTLQNDNDDDDVDSEPYIDHKRLEKRLGKVVKQVHNDTDTKIQNAVQQALAAERRTQWLRNNPDFNEVMSHAQAFADRDPELAETILEMPDGFERQKLVYKNIKALGLHKPAEEKPSIQEKIDQNRRSPFYQPANVGGPGYQTFSAGKEVSPVEGKNAYQKMQELKNRLRI